MDADATLQFYSPILGFGASSDDPAPAFAIVIGSAPGGAGVELTVEDADDMPLLLASGSTFSTGPTGITAILQGFWSPSPSRHRAGAFHRQAR